MEKFKALLSEELERATKLPKEEIFSMLSVPPSLELGDLAFPCFKAGKNPVEAAKSLSQTIKLPKGFSKVEAKGCYLNFYFDRAVFISEALKIEFPIPKKKERVMVEYSQPNTHKGFHIGHLRNVVLGDALVRVMRGAGYEVVAANYIGDIGTHVAKSLWYVDKYAKAKPKENKGQWLSEQYVKAVQLAAKDDKYKEEVDKVHQALDRGDSRWIKLWKETREWSLEEMYAIYKELSVVFDVIFFESEVADKGKEIAKLLEKKGIARLDQGSLLVDLEKFKLGKFLVLKTDGTPLYSTKDLELARKKFEEFRIDRSIYVVGSEQELYFQQLFKTLELMGFPEARKCYHLSYGLVALSTGKMSSRLGNVVSYEELRDRVLKKAISEVKKRHRQWGKEKVESTAKEIALAAMKFTMVNKEKKRVIEFDVNQSMSFEGESGPYLQYVYTRCKSIFRKAKVEGVVKFDSKLLKEAEEFELARMIAGFPALVEEIATSYKVNALPRYLLDLAQLFNQYYQKHRVLDDDKGIRTARLALVDGVAQTIKTGLSLLGINVLEEM